LPMDRVAGTCLTSCGHDFTPFHASSDPADEDIPILPASCWLWCPHEPSGRRWPDGISDGRLRPAGRLA
jgi:hypothetical protein